MARTSHHARTHACRLCRGTSGIDIDLRRVDIDQCPQRTVAGVTQPLNLFAGTDKCKHRTTEVSQHAPRMRSAHTHVTPDRLCTAPPPPPVGPVGRHNRISASSRTLLIIQCVELSWHTTQHQTTTTRALTLTRRVAQCLAISGLGFRRGSYKCTCRKGFYFPDTSIPQKHFNGTALEEEYEKLMMVSH